MKAKKVNVVVIIVGLVLLSTLILGFLYLDRQSNLRQERYLQELKNIEADKEAKQRLEETSKQWSIGTCYYDAEKAYFDQWKSYCEVNKIKIVNDSCTIPAAQADIFNADLARRKEACIARYK